VIYVSGFGGEDAGVMWLDVVTQVATVLCHGSLVWMFQMDMPVMLLPYMSVEQPVCLM
jgi:hypothetical protein